MLNKEGTVVVDAQFPDSAQHLIDEIKKKSSLPYRLLINTHHHGVIASRLHFPAADPHNQTE